MPNMRIMHINALDAALNLTSVPACVTTMPIENLKYPERGKAARVVGVTSWTITGEVLGTLSGMTLVGHNLTGGATVRLYLYSNAAGTVQIYDSTALAIGTRQAWGNPAGSPNGGLAWGVLPWMSTGQIPGTPEYFSHWFTAIANAAAFKIVITDTNNADGYLQIGRIYLGNYWSPRLNVGNGLSMEWRESSTTTRTDGGSLRTEGYMPYRAFSFSLDGMIESDRAEFSEIVRRVGKRVDFLISFYPTLGGNAERDYLAAVKFVSLPNMKSPIYSWTETSAEIEEI